jgi:CheY-like chemotaxis protein
MRKSVSPLRGSAPNRSLDLARVLLVHGELAPRLALRTILQAGGYFVDVAASPSEAITKLDGGRYELVLSDANFGDASFASREAGRDVLAYARVKDYRPATALITSYEPLLKRRPGQGYQVAIHTENLPNLLGEIAELIGIRACRRHRPLRQEV